MSVGVDENRLLALNVIRCPNKLDTSESTSGDKAGTFLGNE
jgi:hypothetical protein